MHCNDTILDSNSRRSVLDELNCGSAGKEMKCIKILCEAGTLMPRSDGLDLLLRMDVRLSVVSKFFFCNP